MSSKNRRLRNAYRRPYGSNEPDSPGSPPTGRKGRLVFWVLLAVVAAGITYAVTRNKPVSVTSAIQGTNPPAKAVAPKPPPPTGPAPRIEYARTYDFGRAVGDSAVDCVFTVTNAGTAPLEIANVSPGCGCMKAGEWTRQIPPGRTGSIPVRLDTRNYTGPFAKSVFVTCNDSNQPSVLLEVKGYIWRPLEITPPTAVVHLSSETPSNNAAVRIISHLDEPLVISDLQSTLPSLAVELQTNAPGKEFQIFARTVPPLPTTRQQGMISFKTSATNAPFTNLMAVINYQPVLQTLPYELRLPPPPLTNSVSLMAWVRNNGTNPLSVTEASVNAPGVTVKTEDDPGNRGIRLALDFPAGFQTTAGTNAELTIKTSHPLHPILRVPIRQPAPPQ